MKWLIVSIARFSRFPLWRASLVYLDQQGQSLVDDSPNMLILGQAQRGSTLTLEGFGSRRRPSTS